MHKKIKLFDPQIGPDEEKILTKVLYSRFWASGSGIGHVKKFEDKFCRYVGAKSCVAVNSGTAALHLALSLCDIKDSEVIVPSLSFATTASSILYNGGKVRFAEVDPATMCIDVKSIKRNITAKTKAILPVHFGGMPANLDEIKGLCKKNKLYLIEDAAHAAGATYKGKKIGSHGNFVCFSFHPVKNLAMPGGGAITINQRDADSQRLLQAKRWCGITDRKGYSYDVQTLGWNYYMNEFSAAMGIVQLQKLERMNKRRRHIAKRYSKEIDLSKKMPYDKDCSYHLYWIQVRDREKLVKALGRKNIETGVHYNPVHKFGLFRSKVSLPITEDAGRTILSVPIHPSLDDDDVSKIVQCINEAACDYS